MLRRATNKRMSLVAGPVDECRWILSPDPIEDETIMDRGLEAKELFEACVELPAESRARFLEDSCRDDRELRGRVQRLLRAHEAAARAEWISKGPALGKKADSRPPTEGAGRRSRSRPVEHLDDEPMTTYCGKCQATVTDPNADRCGSCGDPRPSEAWPVDRLLGRRVAGGQYRVIRRIGSGGFGVVYEVETVVGGLKRALKVLKESWAEHEAVQRRFVNEALVLEQVSHPNVARCFSAGTLEEGGALYLLFELIDGVPLSRLIAAETGEPSPLDPLRAVRIAKQVASGLVAAHAKQVLHRDLKPANILVVDAGTSEERVKLLDFGIAKLVQSDLTVSGHLIGTPSFMAPEQFRPDLPVGVGVDLWQLGATLFTALTGRPPYAEKGDTLESIGNRFRESGRPGPAPSETEPALAAHPALDALVSRLLSTDPADRPESAALVCEELARIEQALSPVGASTLPALLDALCSRPSPDAWSALCRYLSHQDSETRELADQKLSVWPAECRRAAASWWEEVKRGERHPLWFLARTLDLSCRGLTDADVERLSKNPALASLRRLNLAGNGIGPEGIQALAASPFASGIEYLELKGNRIGAEGVEALVRSPHLKRLRFLGLAENRIGVRGLQALAHPALRLQHLDLADNDLRTEGAEVLAQSAGRELRVLNLRGNLLGPDGAAVLAVSAVPANLRELDLACNAIGPGGGASLAVSKNLGQLRKLNLAQNNLGRQGLQLLLSSSGLESLEVLDVSSNVLGPNGAMALASSPLARRLRALEIADNRIEDAGLAALLGTPQLTGLSALGVAQNHLSASGIGLFDGAVLQVESLDLSDNPIEAAGASLLSSAIAQMRVRRLTIRRAALSGSDVLAIIQGGLGCIACLDGSLNDLGEEGIGALARIPELMALKELVLDGTLSGPRGLGGLVVSPYMAGVVRLSLDSNNLGDRGVVEMVSSTGLTSLQDLSLQDNGIGVRGAAALAASPFCSRLRRLDLSFNRLGDAGVEALAQGPAWRQLQEVGLRSNDVGFGGAAAVFASAGMDMLQSVDLSENPLLGQLDIHSLARDKVALMESTFARISADGKGFAERFYAELFERYPGVKPLFARTSMSRQQQHLFSSLVMIIENLRRPDSVEASLAELGRRHVGYGVHPSHYYAVSSALLEAIRETLGEEWNEAVREAWADGLEAVSRVMMSAHRLDRGKG
jgi:serine/threonine protein kinase/hemoglobin-like flavoprotein/Ran GTPase-activating protein (RanGAP) involved in mRNA processing and transport